MHWKTLGNNGKGYGVLGKDGKDWKTLKETMRNKRKLRKTEQVGGRWHCEKIRRREREIERRHHAIRLTRQEGTGERERRPLPVVHLAYAGRVFLPPGGGIKVASGARGRTC